MAPLEKPQEEENNSWQVTQTSINRDSKGTALFLRMEAVETLAYSVLHVDLGVFLLRKRLQGFPDDFVEAAVVSSLVSRPSVKRGAIIEVVVIPELLYRDRPTWRGWTRPTWFEQIIEIIMLREDVDFEGRAQVVTILLEQNELAVAVTPYGKPKAQPTADPVVLVLHLLIKRNIRAQVVTVYADELI